MKGILKGRGYEEVSWKDLPMIWVKCNDTLALVLSIRLAHPINGNVTH